MANANVETGIIKWYMIWEVKVSAGNLPEGPHKLLFLTLIKPDSIQWALEAPESGSNKGHWI